MDETPIKTGRKSKGAHAAGLLLSGLRLRRRERTNDAVFELDGYRWYRTGNMGRMDGDGFITIVDRYSRFAKISG